MITLILLPQQSLKVTLKTSPNYNPYPNQPIIVKIHPDHEPT